MTAVHKSERVEDVLTSQRLVAVTVLEDGQAAEPLAAALTAGGLRCVGGPFPGVRFIPTGGIDAGNVGGYLALRNVVAVGGTWMVPPAMLAARDWDGVQRLTRQAVALVREGAPA